MAHVLQSELGVPVARLMGLGETSVGLVVRFRWKDLSDSEESLEPLSNVFADVPHMVEHYLKRKNTPPTFGGKARAALAPLKRGVWLLAVHS